MTKAVQRDPVVLEPGGGRAYAMGPVHAVFKADGGEWFRARCAADSRTADAPTPEK